MITRKFNIYSTIFGLDDALSGVVLGKGIGAIGNLLGGGIGAVSNHETNQTNLKIAREANQANRENLEYQNQWNLEQWNRENDYNSPLEQRKRLAEAGLNPLSTDMANSQAYHLESGQPQPQVVPQMTPSGGIMAQGLFNMSQQIGDAAKLAADVHLADVQANSIEIDNYIKELSKNDVIEINHWTVENLKSTKLNTDEDTRLKMKSIDKITKEFDLIQSQVDELVSRKELNISQKDFNEWKKGMEEKIYDLKVDQMEKQYYLGLLDYQAKCLAARLGYAAAHEANEINRDLADQNIAESKSRTTVNTYNGEILGMKWSFLATPQGYETQKFYWDSQNLKQKYNFNHFDSLSGSKFYWFMNTGYSLLPGVSGFGLPESSPY